MIALYLWLVFGLLIVYKSVVLAEYHIDFAYHGLALINAATRPVKAPTAMASPRSLFLPPFEKAKIRAIPSQGRIELGRTENGW